MTKKRYIKKAIANGQIDKSISDLLKLTEKTEWYNEIIHQSAKFNKYKQERRIGSIPRQELDIRLNLIIDSLLQITNEIPEESFFSSNIMEEHKNGYFRKRANILLGILLCSILWIWYEGESSKDSLQLTIYVHGKEGKQDYVLENKGDLIVDIRNDRRFAIIGERGRTNFGEIPKKFKGMLIPIFVKAEGFVPAFPDSLYLLNGNPIYYEVKRDESLRKVSGIIKNKTGLVALEGVKVIIDGISTETNKLGKFEIIVPEEGAKDVYQVTAMKKGYQTETMKFYAGSTPIPFRLKKAVK